MNKKLAIITFCIGEVPYWIDYFIKSCNFNKAVDWFYFTDKPVKGNYGPNIKIIDTSLKELSELISAKTNIRVSVKHPYKLCDFRPAFGLIFSDFLRGHDYWGYCDNDLIFGDICFFLGDVLNEDYHIIIPHETSSHGHFCLLRNTSEVNNLFKLSSVYEDIFRSEKLHVFDESFDPKGIKLDNDEIINVQILKRIKKYLYYKKCMNIAAKLKFGVRISEKRGIIKKNNLNDFNKILEYSEEEKKTRIYRKALYECDIMKEINNKGYWRIKWKDGKLYNENSRELLYFHFQVSKYMNRFSIIDKLKEDNSFVFESLEK